MNAFNIYEIEQQYRTALDLIDVDEETGEIQNPDALAFFDVTSENAKQFAESCALYVRELKARREAIATERKRLQEKEASLTKRADHIQESLKSLIDQIGKVKTDRTTIYITKRKKTIVDNPDLLPEDYIKIERKANLTELGKALKAGTKIDGAHLEDSQSLTIR